MLVSDSLKWDRETDVVVVGLGGAGAVAAITAHDRGARVCILEKQPEGNHINNTSMGGALFIQPNDVDLAVEYMTRLNTVVGGLQWTDDAVVRAWAEYASGNAEWVKALGGHPKLFRRGGEHRQLPGYESIDAYVPAGMGFGLMKLLKEGIAKRAIEIFYGMPATKLLANARGEVVGVRARRESREFDIKASRAVIMTLGGFEFNEEMKLNYLRVYPTYFYGSPANTGDGFKMVTEVGADLWHMNCCSARLILKFPDFPIAFAPDYTGAGVASNNLAKAGGGSPCGFIIVDKLGKRYTNEGEIKNHTLYYETALFDSHRLDFPRVPSYWIMDSRRIEQCQLVSKSGPAGLHRLYHWSHDNSEELAKGWIVRGETIEALAEKLHMEAAALKGTVKTYNGYCARGEDPEFTRPAADLKRLDKPPYFAATLFPGGPNTQGGPRRNEKSQVLNTEHRPIPRLYAAGEFGSLFGMIYPAAGGNISECIAYGRIAGENAAAEVPS